MVETNETGPLDNAQNNPVNAIGVKLSLNTNNPSERFL